eukprot:6214038-Pleurochrysis_carterae.AAC.3
MHTKIRHVADDTIGTLHDENELIHFQEHIDTFCAATNMLEKASKRDILPLGATAKVLPENCLTPHVIDPNTGLATTPG